MHKNKLFAVLLGCLLFLAPIVPVRAASGFSLEYSLAPDQIYKDIPFVTNLNFTTGSQSSVDLTGCSVRSWYTDDSGRSMGPGYKSPLEFENLTIVDSGGQLIYETPEGYVPYYSVNGLEFVHFGTDFNQNPPERVDLQPNSQYQFSFELITLADREDIPESGRVRVGDEIYFGLSCDVDNQNNFYQEVEADSVILDVIEKKNTEPKPPPPPPEEIEENPVELPEVFLKGGSLTTKLDELEDDELSEVENLTFEDVDFGRIVYTDPVDLSAAGVKELLLKLDDYLEFRHGVVDLNSSAFLELNAEADVYLYDLNLVPENVSILKNDTEAQGITRINYEDNILSFRVPSFSKYSIAPGLVLDQASMPTETDQLSVTITGKLGDLDTTFLVFANRKQLEIEPTINDDGTFSMELQLDDISNEFELIASSVSGTEEQQNFTIVREPSNKLLGIDFDNPLLLVIAVVLLVVIVLIIGTFLALFGNRFKIFNRKAKKTVPVEETPTPEPIADPTLNVGRELRETRLLGESEVKVKDGEAPQFENNPADSETEKPEAETPISEPPPHVPHS